MMEILFLKHSIDLYVKEILVFVQGNLIDIKNEKLVISNPIVSMGITHCESGAAIRRYYN
jgi:hypothetical protein